MNNLNTEEILRKIARKNNTTIENVHNEIQLAIDAAMADPNPLVKKQWETMKFKMRDQHLKNL